MNTRDAAFDMYTRGMTYAAIAEKLSVSRQRVQQIVRPPKPVYDAIKSAADGKCQKCGVFVLNGHVHHKESYGRTPDNFNDIANLEYLCPSCHKKEHAIGQFQAGNAGNSKGPGAPVKHICSQGHKLSPTTTFKRANGQRECKLCSMARSKAWRESRKEAAKA